MMEKQEEEEEEKQEDSYYYYYYYDDDEFVDILVLIATQSFTGESLVYDILIDQLFDGIDIGIDNIEIKFVDEVFLQHNNQEKVVINQQKQQQESSSCTSAALNNNNNSRDDDDNDDDTDIVMTTTSETTTTTTAVDADADDSAIVDNVSAHHHVVPSSSSLSSSSDDDDDDDDDIRSLLPSFWPDLVKDCMIRRRRRRGKKKQESTTTTEKRRENCSFWQKQSHQQQKQKQKQHQKQNQKQKQKKLQQLPIVLFVASTYGDGEPPHHAIEFANWLSSSSSSLDNDETTTTTTTSLTKKQKQEEEKEQEQDSHRQQQQSQYYAVFGLGDTKYHTKYCEFSKYIDQQLSTLSTNSYPSLQRLLPLYTSDKSNGNTTIDFINWCQSILSSKVVKERVVLSTTKTTTTNNKKKKKKKAQNSYYFNGNTGTEWSRSSITQLPSTSILKKANVMNVIELVNNHKKQQQHKEEEDPTTDNTVVSDLSKLLTRTHHPPRRRRRRQRRRSVVNIKLSIDDDTAAVDNNNNIIQSGDHIGIYPINDPISVQRAMDWLLGLSSSTTKKTDTTTTTTTMIILRRRGKNDNHKLFDDDVPQEISCYEFLSKHVNINGKATSSALFALIPYCGTLELRALARELTYVDIIDIKNHHQGQGQELLQQQQQRGEQQQQQQQFIKEKEEDCTSTTSTTNRLFHDWVGGRKLTVLDLTIMFECRPSIQGFAKICGPIHPRLYSIMDVVTIKTNKSGNNNNKNNEERCCPTTTTTTTATTTKMNINLCVAVDPDGLCSNYLAQQQQSLNHRNVKKSSIHDDDEEEDPMDATTTTTKTKQPDDDITTTTNAINVFFQKSKFHYVSQDNSNIPSILVAAGSGIGVCLGFIQNELDRIIDRQQKKKKVLSDDACSSCSSSEYVEFDKSMDIETDNAEEETINDDSSDDNNKRLLSHLTLFFGCRDQSELLYRDRLVQYQKLGLNLHIAYSRETRRYPKCYVQDLIRQMGRKVWNDLKSSSTTSSENDPKQPGGGGGYVYVCGRLELLEGVKSSLLDVARTVGELDNEGANSFVRQLETSGRIKTDCWSVANNNSITVDAASNSQWPHRRRPHVLLRLERHHDNDNNDNNNNSTISKHCSPTKQIKDLSRISKWPSYLRLLATGELEQRVNRAMDMWSACVACGRNCETNRLSSDPKDWGECRVGTQAIVSSAFPHFGEEDCLRGTRGSGTIFFGACNLQCCYCQNWDISANDEGVTMSDEELAQIMLNLQWKGCHNINFVSPTHNVAPILRALLIAAKKGLRLPLVWNTGGYDSVASLRLLDGIIDIYMPDAKYASRSVARRLSKIDNYPEINQAVIKEMHRQVGDLELDPDTGLAIRGVLVRHLILPKRLAGTCDVMSFLAREVSKDTFTNVMDQYRPEHHAVRDKKFGLNKRPTSQELNEAHEEAKVAGLHRFDGEFRHPSYLDW